MELDKSLQEALREACDQARHGPVNPVSLMRGQVGITGRWGYIEVKIGDPDYNSELVEAIRAFCMQYASQVEDGRVSIHDTLHTRVAIHV